MGESKEIYFGFLQSLDMKYNKNESPSIAENLKVEQLLAGHDRRVKAFNTAMSTIEDNSARLVINKQINKQPCLAPTLRAWITSYRLRLFSGLLPTF